MKTIYKIKFLLPIAFIVMASCNKQLDINVDPNNPQDLSESKLLPRIERFLGYSLSIGGQTVENGTQQVGGLSDILSVYTHQLTTRESPDQYGATGNSYYLQGAWNGLYKDVLMNLKIVIDAGTENGNLRYVGIAKILKAYTYSQLVDVFGDVPFSEASLLEEQVYNAKFDDGEEIYPQLLALIDEGISDLSNEDALNLAIPATDDIIYSGDVSLWIKAANTLKLKLYTQIRLVQNVSNEINALLAEDNLISQTSESFVIPFGPNDATDDRNSGYGDYFASQRGHYISPWFYEILKGYNPNINTGIEDPRLPYYIYNQRAADQATESNAPTEYRDGGFISIYFGSTGPYRDQAQQNNMSLLGIYPVGGKYDDGNGGNANASSGTGAAPYRLITYADRLYLEAELMNTGVISGDARAKFEEAVDESFKQVDYVITNFVRPSQVVPVLYSDPATADYIAAIMDKYDAGDTNKKLEYIMTQKWLSSYGGSIDQYTDYRRTAYPVLFDPRNASMAPGGRVQPPVDGDPFNPGKPSVQVQLDRNYPQSLPWYQTELETNSSAPSQKADPSTYNVFWRP